MRKDPLPTPQSIHAMAEKHLARLKLGMLFEGYSAKWHGEDTLQFVTLIDRLCKTLDRHGPALLDEICARRMEEVGLDPNRGAVILASTLRQKKNGTYSDTMAPNCFILRNALARGEIAYWNQTGCEAMFNLLTELIRLGTVVLPQILADAETADPFSLEEFRQKV